eukprot:COSAG05_NODE_2387_length_3132_cov_1.598088_1_plen_89_part_10
MIETPQTREALNRVCRYQMSDLVNGGRDPGEGVVDDKTASLVVFVALIVVVVGGCYFRSFYKKRSKRQQREEQERQELELRTEQQEQAE